MKSGAGQSLRNIGDRVCRSLTAGACGLGQDPGGTQYPIVNPLKIGNSVRKLARPTLSEDTCCKSRLTIVGLATIQIANHRNRNSANTQTYATNSLSKCRAFVLARNQTDANHQGPKAG